ncbi:MAG: outer membrane protein assembly factor BamC [Proteobacteria bacterium]|nr:outer membrane protein assembly factor BamC [Pseudomonadota bacterium]
MINQRVSLLIISLLVITACSKIPKIDEVLPDKRTAYQKSKDLPALEVPPDLTVTEGEYRATIPGEAESTTLSEFQRQRDQRERRGNVVLGSGEAEDERWLALKGSIQDIWPRLQEFWTSKGYKMDLDDAELGVMETGWKQGEISREKYRIFAEADEEGGTILFMSSERQELSEGTWLDASVDSKREKETLRELNLHFYGAVADSGFDTNTSAASSTASNTISAPRLRAEIVDIGDGKSYLAIPQEFTRAWRETENVILRAGYTIESKDQERGTYNFLYFIPEGEKEEGFLSKLKFWGDDEDEGIPYQLSLTGVGDKTEAIIMNSDGEWETDEQANNILGRFKDIYNQL